MHDALAILDVIDGIVDDTHPEGDGCPLCVALDDLRAALDRSDPAVGLQEDHCPACSGTVSTYSGQGEGYDCPGLAAYPTASPTGTAPTPLDEWVAAQPTGEGLYVSHWTIDGRIIPVLVREPTATWTASPTEDWSGYHEAVEQRHLDKSEPAGLREALDNMVGHHNATFDPKMHADPGRCEVVGQALRALAATPTASPTETEYRVTRQTRPHDHDPNVCHDCYAMTRRATPTASPTDDFPTQRWQDHPEAGSPTATGADPYDSDDADTFGAASPTATGEREP